MKIIITEHQLKETAIAWMNINFSPDQLEVVKSKKYPNSIFFKKNGKIVMQQDKKNKEFWFDCGEIWSFFESFFNMKYKEIQDVLRTWLKETFKLEGYRPLIHNFDNLSLL